jgi:tricorn protease interacting factor F2/3
MLQPRPIDYRIELTPELSSFRFAGQVEIDMEADSNLREIVLNALDLAVWRCRVRQGETFLDCSFDVDPQKETLRVHLPEAMRGRITLRAEFEGIINDKLGGWYRSGYTVDGRPEFMAVTQFQESHARQVFPCFDAPEKKAVFDITLVVDRRLCAVSNQEILEETRAPNGKKRIRFRKTPRMSTYLLFLGVGHFDLLVDGEDRRVRALAAPGQISEAAFGLEFGRKALLFCEDYFGIPYPLSKMDLIAVPDFAFGAMENWGAITFRENLLLYHPRTTSKAGMARICEVVAHEIVHQWFGNLASPSDWKYLWLNESFATFTSYAVVDHYYPEWGTWEQFVHSQSASALARDGLFETFPIEIPGGEHVVINTATAPIIYNKGGSVLRQIKGYLGETGYREGLHQYLKAHAYGCAASADLWEALERAAGKPVSALMKSWVEQPGFPLVEARRDGREMVLTQQRFTYLPRLPDALLQDADAPAPGRWLIPLSLWVMTDGGEVERRELLMDGPEARIELGDAAFKVNAGQTGFYRVRYLDRADLTRLGPLVLEKRLDAHDRWGLVDDLFALVRRGDASIGEYLDFLRFYAGEDAFLPLSAIADHLHLSSLVLPDPAAGGVREAARVFLDGVLSRIGYAPVGEETHATAILRDQVLPLAACFGAERAASFAMAQFERLTSGEAVHPDIMKGVAQVGAMLAPETACSWLMERIGSSGNEHERMNLLSALGWLRGERHIRKALAYAVSQVPSRNKHIPITVFAMNPDAAGMMWQWYGENREALRRFHPLLFERVLSSILPIAGMSREGQVWDYFKDDFGREGVSAAVVRMSLEKLAVNVRMRASHTA